MIPSVRILVAYVGVWVSSARFESSDLVRSQEASLNSLGGIHHALRDTVTDAVIILPSKLIEVGA